MKSFNLQNKKKIIFKKRTILLFLILLPLKMLNFNFSLLLFSGFLFILLFRAVSDSVLKVFKCKNSFFFVLLQNHLSHKVNH